MNDLRLISVQVTSSSETGEEGRGKFVSIISRSISKHKQDRISPSSLGVHLKLYFQRVHRGTYPVMNILPKKVVPT